MNLPRLEPGAGLFFCRSRRLVQTGSSPDRDLGQTRQWLFFRPAVIGEGLPRRECRRWIVALVLKVKLSRRQSCTRIAGSRRVEDLARTCSLLSRSERKPDTDL